MRFNCLRSEIKNKLSLVGLAIAKRPTHPIMANVAIKVKSEKIILVGSDLSFTIKTKLEGTILEKGNITVPYSLLYSMIDKSPEGEIAFSCEDETENNPTLKIQSWTGRYELKGVTYNEYPKTQREITTTTSLHFNTQQLKQGITYVLPCFAKNETKQVLTGISFKINSEDQLTLAATDGYRLACITLEDSVSLETTDQIEKAIREEPFVELEDNNYDFPEDEIDEEDNNYDFPEDEIDEDNDNEEDNEEDNKEDNEEDNEEDNKDTEAIEEAGIQLVIKGTELTKLLTILGLEKFEDIILRYDNENLSFELGETLITSRVLQGSFPKYEQLIPKTFKGNLLCDKADFEQALKRASVLLDGHNNLITLSLDQEENTVTFVSTAKELGEAKQTITTKDVSTTSKMGFNNRYLEEAIKQIKSTQMRIDYNEPNNPVIIKEISDVSAMTLLMPVNLR